jgi:hypothetical protein
MRVGYPTRGVFYESLPDFWVSKGTQTGIPPFNTTQSVAGIQMLQLTQFISEVEDRQTLIH